MTIATWGVCLPLCLLSTAHALRFTSTAAMASMTYVGVLAVVYFFQPALDVFDPCSAGAIDGCLGSTSATTPVNFSFVKSLSTFFFAFNCHPLLFNIYNEIRDPSVRTMDNILVVWGIFVSFLYGFFGLCGYFTYGDGVSSNVLKDWPLTAPATVARCAISLSVMLSYPLLMQSGRTVILHLINLILPLYGKEAWTEPTHKLQKILHWAICFFHLTFGFTVSCLVTDLGLVFALVGATGATLTCYIIPGFMYWKYFKDDEPSTLAHKIRVKAALCLGIFGLIYMPIGIASVFVN